MAVAAGPLTYSSTTTKIYGKDMRTRGADPTSAHLPQSERRIYGKQSSGSERESPVTTALSVAAITHH